MVRSGPNPTEHERDSGSDGHSLINGHMDLLTDKWSRLNNVNNVHGHSSHTLENQKASWELFLSPTLTLMDSETHPG